MANISKLTLPNNITYDIKDNVSQFGGTNLLKYSSWKDAYELGIFKPSTSGDAFESNKIWFPSQHTVHFEHGFSFSYTTGNFSDSAWPFSISLKSTNIIFSIWIYENTLDNDFSFSIMRKVAGKSEAMGNMQRISVGQVGLLTADLSEISSSIKTDGYYINMSPSTATSGHIVLGPPKIEIGNKPTEWTPSPWEIVTYKNNSLVFLS